MALLLQVLQRVLVDTAGRDSLDRDIAVLFQADGFDRNPFHLDSRHIVDSGSTLGVGDLARIDLAHTVGFDRRAALDMAAAADAAAADAEEDIADIVDIPAGHFLHHSSLDLHLVLARHSPAAGSLGLGLLRSLGYSRIGPDLLRSRSYLELKKESLDEEDVANSLGRYELTRLLLV